MRLNGWCADSAWTYTVGEVSTEARALMEVTFADLTVGQTVAAWFTGPVAESYPVQVKASQIVIVG